MQESLLLIILGFEDLNKPICATHLNDTSNHVACCADVIFLSNQIYDFCLVGDKTGIENPIYLI